MPESNLLTLFDKLIEHRLSSPEATFLNIGGRGYYENPTSDLLRFFLYPKNAHGLGTLFIEALLSASNINVSKESLEFLNPVERETLTTNNNRIDLLIQAPGWILLVENKIRHEVNNPFSDYENLANQRKKPEDKTFFLILSPQGDSHQENWKGISYQKLITEITKRLAICTPLQKSSKWWHFAMDFTLHLDQELYEKPMTNDQIKFAEQNFTKLSEAAQMQNRYRKHVREHLKNRIEKDLNLQDVSFSNDRKWAEHFYSASWPESYPVWRIEPDEDTFKVCFSIYMNYATDSQIQSALNEFALNTKLKHSVEGANTHIWQSDLTTDKDEAESSFIKAISILASVYSK